MQYLVRLFAMCCEEDAHTCVLLLGKLDKCLAAWPMSGTACQDTKTIYVIGMALS